MLFTPRLLVSKKVLGMSGSTDMVREVSPPPGASTLITSAPRSAISMYGTVPAWAVEQVTTFTPCRGPCGWLMRLCSLGSTIGAHSPSLRWHAALWYGVTSRSAGSSLEHRSIAYGQRA